MQLPDEIIPKIIEMLEQHNIKLLLENDLLTFENLRDTAIALELVDLDHANELMKFALLLRPNAEWIRKKIDLYRQMLDANTKGYVVVNGLTLFIDENVSLLILRAIINGNYEKQEFQLAQETISSDDIVLELGAGIGFLASSISSQCKKYISYEANPKLLPLIKKSREKNNSNFEIFNGVMLDQDGSVEFYVTHNYMAGSLIKPLEESTAVQVKSFDKNKILNKEKPTALIVDIEGGELNFFRNLRLESVRKILIEIHPKVLEDKELCELYNIFLSNGFILNFKKSTKAVLYWYKK